MSINYNTSIPESSHQQTKKNHKHAYGVYSTFNPFHLKTVIVHAGHSSTSVQYDFHTCLCELHYHDAHPLQIHLRDKNNNKTTVC